MPKLNEEKIKWIIRRKKKRELTTQDIASIQNVTTRRVKQLWQEYKQTGEVPQLKRPGRPVKPIREEEVEMVLEAHSKHKVGACILEALIMKEYGRRIPHNRIHKILKLCGRAKNEPRKQRRRKWIRYERSHSMSLWHTDWCWVPSLGKWLIAYEDDASRLITGYGTFTRATSDNAIQVYRQAAHRYGDPDELLTDRGTQFYADAGEKKARGLSSFEQFLIRRGVHQIVGRVNHPQTNGKIERFYGTVADKLPDFDDDLDRLVEWHNDSKPHMSLRWRRLETPNKAFWVRLPPERVFAAIGDWFWENG